MNIIKARIKRLASEKINIGTIMISFEYDIDHNVFEDENYYQHLEDLAQDIDDADISIGGHLVENEKYDKELQRASFELRLEDISTTLPVENKEDFANKILLPRAVHVFVKEFPDAPITVEVHCFTLK